MIDHLLVVAATHRVAGEGPTDGWNRSEVTHTPAAEPILVAQLEPVGSSGASRGAERIEDDVDALVATHTTFTSADNALGGRDELVIGGQTYRLTGTPKRWTTPDGRSYLEVRLHHVE